MNTSDSVVDVRRGPAPMTLVRSGVALADLVAMPILALAFLVVLGAALGSLGIAAGGINFILGLHYLDFFPTFPPVARILSGLSLLAFSILMAACALLLWHFYRGGWKRFWSWHRSAWGGASRSPPPPASRASQRAGPAPWPSSSSRDLPSCACLP